jgi:hypothetical protein
MPGEDTGISEQRTMVIVDQFGKAGAVHVRWWIGDGERFHGLAPTIDRKVAICDIGWKLFSEMARSEFRAFLQAAPGLTRTLGKLTCAYATNEYSSPL